MNSHRTFESCSSPTKSEPKSARASTPRLTSTGSPEKRKFDVNEDKALANMEKKLIGRKGKSTQDLDPGTATEVKAPLGHQPMALNENNNNDSYISSVGDSFDSNQNAGALPPSPTSEQ